MRVLVTGGAGFVGRHVVDALLAAGHAVRVLDIDGGVDLPEGVERLTGSILDDGVVREAVAGMDGVVHAAAIAHLWTRDPADYERVNVGGTARVLGAAREAGAGRMVHVSSYTTLVSAPRRPHRVLDERVELPPEAMLGPYPASKRRAEIIAAEAGAVIVLPSAPVGPGDVHVTPPTAMIRDLAARKLPAMLDCRFNFVDVRALAGGIVAALERSGPGKRYLLTGVDMTTDEFLALFERVSGVKGPKARVPYWVALAAAHVEAVLSRVTGKPPKAPLTGVRLAGIDASFDNARARRELGFAPPPVDEALRAALGEAG